MVELQTLISNANYLYFSSTNLAVYKVSEYRAIPCVIVIVDGVVTYVGGPYKEFLAALEAAVEEPLSAKEE